MVKRLLTSLNAHLTRITELAAKRLTYRWWWYAASIGIVVLVSAAYLVAAGDGSSAGYPLDDAWIHQCYARTLAQTGELAFAPGQPSTGSTSLLWTFLLALGYMLRLPPVPWSYGMGALAWLLTAWTAQSLARKLFPRQHTAVPWVALACLLEWHLAWAALSGMEITLFCLFLLLLLERYAARARPLWLGVLGGVLVWVRPEGLLLTAGTLLAAAFTRAPHTEQPNRRAGRETSRAWLSRLLLLGIGLALSLAPYLALNLVLSGQPFPSTLYAKQAEYRVLLEQPIWRRLWVVARRPLVGAQALLLPGFVWQAYVALRQSLGSLQTVLTRPRTDRSEPETAPPLAALLPVAWWAATHLLYALRLPVDYQHGRYLMPTIPILLLYGVTGTLYWLRRAAHGARGSHALTRVWTRTLAGALAVLTLAFLVLGGQSYVTDRRIIQHEMVDVALWLREHTPPDTLIAAHDIGAIGYWAERPLLDLAGLINPDVIPIMRDETRLLEYILDRQADYLVTFPSWYPEMTQDARLSHRYPTQAPATPLHGQDHMTVYRIQIDSATHP